MPGIAGIVLTLAVAVDANVLINERIKEELSNGRSVQQAIDEGYKGAFSSIFDANNDADQSSYPVRGGYRCH
jgi:preprotein translocase subunit SecD